MITIHHYLILSALLFVLGLIGLTVRKNLLVVFMCIEVLLNAVNLAFVALARYLERMEPHVVVFFVMAVAAAEAAVGLAIVITLYRNRQTVKTTDWRIMSG
ncbi:MAG: NADH-quinone oxidoreductase subunit NuoK [Deltaproteobacteria bacterium]|nr:NADH-quinone oxidoreductase subunit NuoK [Deltaproteobacteria bacterium]